MVFTVSKKVCLGDSFQLFVNTYTVRAFTFSIKFYVLLLCVLLLCSYVAEGFTRDTHVM